MKQKSKLSAAEADLLAMKLRRENMVASHKAMMEEYKARRMIKDTERIKNLQNQYGALQDAFSRLPLGLQDPAHKRMRDIGLVLTNYRRTYDRTIPNGPMPDSNRLQEIRRRVA